jgi:hypothetical protein
LITLGVQLKKNYDSLVVGHANSKMTEVVK